MPTASERALLDTNMLVYAVYEDSEHHAAAKRVVESARDARAGLCVTPQIFAELFAVVTNPRRVSLPHAPEEALTLIEWALALPGLAVLPIPPDVTERWMTLMRRRPMRGAAVFDLQIVAIMMANDVRRIWTFNVADFSQFPEIEVVKPTLAGPAVS